MIPDLETSDVELKGPPAEIQREPFHQRLVLGKDRVAGIAHFAVAWTFVGSMRRRHIHLHSNFQAVKHQTCR